jgi:phage baseplate assembly protein W
VAAEIKINPIDLNPDMAIGMAIPIMQGAGAIFNMNYLSIDQAYANAKNLLLTERGERIMHPDFGCNLRSLLFENITNVLQTEAEESINESFSYWLPYIFINNLDIITQPDTNTIRINMVISLQNNTLDTRSINMTLNTQ